MQNYTWHIGPMTFLARLLASWGVVTLLIQGLRAKVNLMLILQIVIMLKNWHIGLMTDGMTVSALILQQN